MNKSGKRQSKYFNEGEDEDYPETSRRRYDSEEEEDEEEIDLETFLDDINSPIIPKKRYSSISNLKINKEYIVTKIDERDSKFKGPNVDGIKSVLMEMDNFYIYLPVQYAVKYCDVFQKCREVDPSGPLATLRKLLLSEESIATFKKWIESNWYTVVLATVGIIVLLVLSTKLLGKRNVKLKSVTIIHSATTETVRLPEDNNGVIVHTAVRTKVPFKKKVRGQRGHKAKIITKKFNQQKIISKAKSKGSNGGSSSAAPQSLPNKSTSTTIIATSSININKNPLSVTNTIVKTKIPTVLNKRSSSSEILKTVYCKKNRTNIGEKAVNKINDYKNSKKSNKKKEVIDYSKGSAGPNISRHTNTFGKVQKWLIDSPIVAEPLSHLEHSSKIRNVMAKSQSTPDRLVQKSLQKTKSIGNLSNEKVKLQVVYKPPFKFSLKLSTNSTVKTHIINSALYKSKRKTRSIGVDKKKIGVAPTTSLKSSQECERRSAFLIKSTDKTEGQKLNLMDSLEPNYETLEHPDKVSDKTPLYENIYINSTENLKDLNKTMEKNDDRDFPKSFSKEKKIPHVFRINRSASNSYIDSRESCLNKNLQPQSYSCSNSVSHNAGAPFLKPILSSRKTSDNSLNFCRNFGSTQNLIAYNHNNLAKSKQRKSLNLKNNTESSDTKPASASKKPSPDAALFAATGFVLPRQNNSNKSLRRKNSASNLGFSADNYDNITMLLPQHRGSTANLLKLSSSSNAKGSIKNIPRASLSNNSTTTTNALLIGASQQLNNLSNTSSNNQYHHQQHRTPSPSNNINNMNSNNNSLLHQHSEKCSIVNYNILGNQLNNLNKPNSSDNINTRQLPFDLPPPNKKQQISQLSASEDDNQNNQNNYNTQSKNINNSYSNSSSNDSISNNNGNSSCNNITNISSNIPVISNILSQPSYNFLLTSQQHFTTTPFNSASTNTDKTNLNKKISNTSVVNNSANNIYNSTNSKDQKNILNKSKNFNNKTSPKPTKASTSSSAINSTINTNNDFEISSDLEVMVSDIENLVS